MRQGHERDSCLATSPVHADLMPADLSRQGVPVMLVSAAARLRQQLPTALEVTALVCQQQRLTYWQSLEDVYMLDNALGNAHERMMLTAACMV